MTSPIDPRHLSEPGLAVLDITAADEDTAHALMDGLQQLWATSGITPPDENRASPASTPGSTPTSTPRPHETHWSIPARAPASTPRRTTTPTRKNLFGLPGVARAGRSRPGTLKGAALGGPAREPFARRPDGPDQAMPAVAGSRSR
ncbi:DUF6207 family protein [Streptomyces microflavus]|uniref:DUF6207 family protein n=1 Tax=Streptomyces microflavus TaxID=1919 RepID=UPI003B2253C4